MVAYGTKEFHELQQQFERDAKKLFSLRLDREKDKEWHKRGMFYENGDTNKFFQLYIAGFSYASSVL